LRAKWRWCCGLLGLVAGWLLCAATASAATVAVNCRTDSSALATEISAASPGDLLLVKGHAWGRFLWTRA
jgi:hypothetical protein